MKTNKIISLILVVIWMIFIFVMSSFDGNESSSQSNFVVNFIVYIFNISNIDVVSLIIRKLAHFTEYLILGILVCNMIRCYDKKYYLAIIICIIYAVSDEVHQVFVPGRSPQIYDILIDVFGCLSGIILFNMFIKIKKNKKFENKG